MRADWPIQRRYLEDARYHREVSPRPHLLDDVCVRLGNLALHSQRVAEVELAQVGAQQEVLSQRGRVAQTLWAEKVRGRGRSQKAEK